MIDNEAHGNTLNHAGSEHGVDDFSACLQCLLRITLSEIVQECRYARPGYLASHLTSLARVSWSLVIGALASKALMDYTEWREAGYGASGMSSSIAAEPRPADVYAVAAESSDSDSNCSTTRRKA